VSEYGRTKWRLSSWGWVSPAKSNLAGDKLVGQVKDITAKNICLYNENILVVLS